MTNNSTSTFLLSGLLFACSMAAHAQIIPNYTGWMNDYDGTEAGTLILYKFDGPASNNTTPNMASNLVIDKNMVLNLAGTTRGVPGKFGSGFQVDNPYSNAASTGYGQVGAPGIFSATESPYISVEFWYSTPNASPGDSLNYLVDYQYSSNDGFQLFTPIASAGSQLAVSIGNGTAKMTAVSTDLTWVSDQFYHIAFTYNALTGELKLYRDGEVVAQNTNADFGNIADYSGNLRLGNRLASSFRNTPGTYDNFRISDTLYEYTAIPEPATVALFFGVAVLGLTILRRRRQG